MDKREIYQDIAVRTDGDVYIGVVGPVRCGKSTFIKKFMETSVIPNISGEYDRKRASDELPQSAGGKTVMTTEPKFIPDEAVEMSFGDNVSVRVRMIDCVGYMIPDALGDTEDGQIRMVKTPWSDESVPFEIAAEEGTRKVIREHSTVGMLVTCDGSFGDIPRENYIEAEEKTAAELKSIGKPFAVILNSKDPSSAEAEELALELEKKYDAPVALVNCLELDTEDVEGILEMLLYEFPVTEIDVSLPGWVSALPIGHSFTEKVISSMKNSYPLVRCLNDSQKFADTLGDMLSEGEGGNGKKIIGEVTGTDLATGVVSVEVKVPDCYYYNVLCDLTGICVSNEKELVSVMMNLSDAKRELEKYETAITDLENTGYGIVIPDIEDLKLEDPQIIRQSGSYGVKLRARASSIHMIRADIETEINPIVGTEEQSEEMIKYLTSQFEDDPQKLWESNIFGKSLYQLVNDGLHTKLMHLNPESREKLSETLSRIVNESSNGLICILL